MAGQVMEAQARLQPPAVPLFAALPPNCKNDIHHLTTTMTTAAMTTPAGSNATAAAADMAAYLQQLRDSAAAASDQASRNGGGGARGEQCPRCASHDTKFCYYNNYNTSQPRHFCRACRRYWTLGGSLRNVPIGGSTRKRPRLAHLHHQPAAARRAPHVFGLGLGGAPLMPLLPPPSTQGPHQGGGGSLLSSLFALGAGAPLLEGRGAEGFVDLGLGLPAGPCLLGAGEPGIGMQMQGLGLRGGGGGSSAPGSVAGASSSFMWPAGLLDSDSVDTWKMPSAAGAGSTMWPEFSVGAAPQTSGLLHGGAQLM